MTDVELNRAYRRFEMLEKLFELRRLNRPVVEPRFLEQVFPDRSRWRRSKEDFRSWT